MTSHITAAGFIRRNGDNQNHCFCGERRQVLLRENMTQDNANHDAVPAAIAPVDRLVRLGATDRESVGTDKAEPLTRDCGTGNTTDRPHCCWIAGAGRVRPQAGSTQYGAGSTVGMDGTAGDGGQPRKYPASTPQVSLVPAEMYHALVVAHKAIARLRLTDAEREAVERASVAYDLLPTEGARQISATLRGLLERTK